METSRRYSSWVLFLLTVTYVLNFVDRQILSILAEDIQHDLGLSDSTLGFLYGTMFGVFYCLFGIPFGRLADSWNRVRLLTIGIALWSFMTAASSFARSGLELALARFGVGIGEATASPCAYSLISDYFPKSRRATALAIYSSGIFIGAGLSLALAGFVLVQWKAMYPGNSAPFGLAAWQATFLIVGIPGLLLALVVSTLREPLRGESEGVLSTPSARPFHGFMTELLAVVPPLTLIRAAKRGRRPLIVNALCGLFIMFVCFLLIQATHSYGQWIAIGVGTYAVVSWATSLRDSDLPTFRLIWATPTFLYVTVGYGLSALSGYAFSFWAAPYAMRYLAVTPGSAGLYIGGASALSGFLGVIVGGRLSDHFRAKNPSGRIGLVIVANIVGGLLYALCFVATNSTAFYILVYPTVFVTSMTLAACAATTQDLVMPRMRGTATASFFIGTTFIGMANGPYLAGKLSEVTGELWIGLMLLLLAAPVSIFCLVRAYQLLPDAENTRLERARAAGEVM